MLSWTRWAELECYYYYYYFFFDIQTETNFQLNWTQVQNRNIFVYMEFNDGWDVLNPDNRLVYKLCIPSHTVSSHVASSTNIAGFPFKDITFQPLNTFDDQLDRGWGNPTKRLSPLAHHLPTQYASAQGHSLAADPLQML